MLASSSPPRPPPSSSSGNRNGRNRESSPLSYPDLSSDHQPQQPSKSKRFDAAPSSDLVYPNAYSPAVPSSIPEHHRPASQRDNMTDPLFTELGSASNNRSAPRLPRGDVSSSRLVFDRLRSNDIGSSQGNRRRPAAPDNTAHNTDQMRTDNDGDNQEQIIWGTTISIAECMLQFKRFLNTFRKEHDAAYGMAVDNNDLNNDRPFYIQLLQDMKEREIYVLNLDCSNLLEHNTIESKRLHNQLVRYPQEMVPIMDHVLTELFTELFQDVQMHGTLIRMRPFNIGISVSMRDLDPLDIDQLVTIKGMLIRTSSIIPEMKKAFFRCSICDQTLPVEVDRGRVLEPTVCPNDNCKSKNTMTLVHQRCTFADKQIYKVQEIPDETPDGQTPYTVTVITYDDLADVAKPGDRVEITGVYRGVPVRENAKKSAVKALFRTYIDAMHIKRTDKKRLGIDPELAAEEEATFPRFVEGDELKTRNTVSKDDIIQLSQVNDLYNLLSRSVAPSIFGMEDVKKGVLLQLFGGTSKFTTSGEGKKATKIRGDINVLIVGDPGVSKSQLLQYVHRLSPRGVYTSGKGSSAVGLTAYVTRDPETKQYVLESGALVLSDGGICCIDEFDKMSDSTRSILHEVMEQQTISVAKAGIITTLNARTSILAAANPIHSKFDEKLPIVANINLPPPLMSRFDLLYLALDKPNDSDDRRLAKHLVDLYSEESPEISNLDFVPLEKFIKYISYAKKLTPQIGEAAGAQLVANYVEMRRAGKVGGRNIVTATTRQLESMIRLSEAHARMRLSETVEKSDVDEAYRLIQTALQTSAVDPSTGRVDMDLVTTGISTRVRNNQSIKRDSLKAVIDSFPKDTIKFVEILKTYREKEQEKTSEFELKNLLEDLCDGGVIHMRGKMATDSVIYKIL